MSWFRYGWPGQSNYTAGHETLARQIGEARFDYPDRHIEADNRLSWFLGGLERRFGKAPLYVHLRRHRERVAESFARRWGTGIIRAFNDGIVLATRPEEQRLDVCRFYVDTVTANIDAFLRDKPRTMSVWLEEAEDWFPAFWERIGGEGDLQAGLAEFKVPHNASPSGYG